jgi:chromosomal replication initiation ATPase DnaA
VPHSDPRFNQTVRCDVCGLGQQEAYLRELCGLSVTAQGWQFTNTERTSANAQVYDVAQILAGQPQRWLTMLSPEKFGVGKTRLMACVLNAARAAGHTAVYTTTADVLDYLRDAYGPDTQRLSYDGRMDLLRTCRVLCLDEFDRWNPTSWAQEKFFQLLNYRYEHGAELLTAFAANANVANLPGYVASRMQDVDNFLFILNGADVRRLRRN